MSACDSLGIDVEFIRSHKKYRDGFFVEAIEKSLEDAPKISKILEEVSGHKLGDTYSPIQVMEGEYLKKRPFVSLDKESKTLKYLDKDSKSQEISYAKGEVKLDWRIDWPARWWLLSIDVEPAGRDHSTKGGSFDTGLAIVKDVFDVAGPLPVPYDFINLSGDNKKMSASKGTGLDAAASAQILPPEVLRYFILQSAPSKRLYFDPVEGSVKIIDEFAALLAKSDKSESDEQLLDISGRGADELTVTNVPFSHLVASYQSALKDPQETIKIIKRTEYGGQLDAAMLKKELV
jgi:lysyl-tRNA synthetase class 1